MSLKSKSAGPQGKWGKMYAESIMGLCFFFRKKTDWPELLEGGNALSENWILMSIVDLFPFCEQHTYILKFDSTNHGICM